MNPGPRPIPSTSATPFASARVVAIGRAGAEMAAALQAAGDPGFSFAALDGDAVAVEQLPWEDKVFVGARLTRGFGAGGDPDLARAAADDEVPALRALCDGHGLVFLLAGLGGGSGTGIAPVVARVARETGASVFAFVSLPFACEGSRRQQQALAGLYRLKTVADGVLCLPAEKLLALSDDRTTLLGAFEASREHIRDAVLCVWNLLTRPGLLNVSYADLCSVLRGPNLESAFARVTAGGPERAERALEGLMAHPLLARGETLRRAESLLVSFDAGADLGMAEIRRIMDELNRQAEGARVVVGASLTETESDRLTLSVLASTRQLVIHETAEDPIRTVSLPAAIGAPREGEGSGPMRHLVPPAPELTPDLARQVMAQGGGAGRGRRKKPQQVQLPFEVITKGRFEKCEPTVRRGNNLDQPTYLRRGVPLN
ncbi:MAG: hypothetical protein KF833_06925 [Verrucomicrobiae bacterium]|nr:hypothetical protein [Verrucomicrobiae bacterium]